MKPLYYECHVTYKLGSDVSTIERLGFRTAQLKDNTSKLIATKSDRNYSRLFEAMEVLSDALGPSNVARMKIEAILLDTKVAP